MHLPCFKHIGLLPWLAAFFVLPGHAQKIEPLPNAHAHNDYEHPRPLLDALDKGFCSVEADIYLIDGKLLVSHDRKDVKNDRTLVDLYLDPLKKRIEQNGGLVYAESSVRFFLLIDIKSDARATYAGLHATLRKYGDMLTKFEGGKIEPGAVTVVVSGNRPREEMLAQRTRFAGYDGRLSDLKDSVDSYLMPWISDNWRNHFRWRGEGTLTAEEEKKVKNIVSRCHKAGCMIRFWAIPDQPNVWQTLHRLGVDFINTDHLGELRETLTKKNCKISGA